jgi:hypothetical protein
VAQFSDHALNMMATRLSQFTNPTIPELTLKDDKTLQNNMLESVLGLWGGDGNARVRHIITNEVRRVFASIETYRLGRQYALKYVSGNRHWEITPYFLALTFFESCVAYSWQVCDHVLSLGLSGEKVFKPGDGSGWERLHGIYTIGTKHSSGRYDVMKHGEMPTTVWLTNDGIECIAGSKITFQELTEVIAANNALFYEAQKHVRVKLESRKKPPGNDPVEA